MAKADVVLAKDLQAAWGAYAATERSAVTANARERATIGADYKKEVAGAELAAVKEVAPARKTSMVDAAEANGVYHVKVTGIIADLGILGGQIHVEQVKAKATSISAWVGQKAQGLWDKTKDAVAAISKSYDAISMATHTALSAGGMVPAVGLGFDLADLALTAVELPFGKSDGKDLGLATLGVFATAAPGPVDVAAGGVKTAARTAKAGVKVADGVGTAGRCLDASTPFRQMLHGAGNGPGIFVIGSRARSTAVVRRALSDGTTREFVYLPSEGIFAINKHLDYRRQGPRFPGSDGSPHSTIRSTLPEADVVVGGTIRSRNGKLLSDEMSGHYGRNWTDEIRRRFGEFMREQGVEVEHASF